MKKLSTKHLIPIIAGAVALITTLTITLSLAMCDYEEPDLSKYGITTGDRQDGQNGQSNEVHSPYGMFDYSLRAYTSGRGPFLYKNDAYKLNNNGQLRRISLNELDCDLKTATEETHHIPEEYPLCPDNAHDHIAAKGPGHGQRDTPWTCPDEVGSGPFLIDAYESAGNYPIIYYTTNVYHELKLKGEAVFQEGEHIYRYDTGDATRKKLYSSNDFIMNMLNYGDTIFFVTQSADGEVALHSLSKDGKSHESTVMGNELVVLMDVYDESLILRDQSGSVYRVPFDLESVEEIFRNEEDLTLSWNSSGFTFVDGDYLYYCADFKTVDYYPYPDHPDFLVQPLSHSVRRVRLDAPDAESELIAENVFDDQMYGISEGIFYYAPCEPTDFLEGYYFNFTSGKIKGVDIETLEEVEMKEDYGILAAPSPKCTVTDCSQNSLSPRKDIILLQGTEAL